MRLTIPRDAAGNPEIRFRLIRERRPLSLLIRRRTNCAVSHGEIADADGWWIGAQPAGGVMRRAPGYIAPSFELRVAIPASEAAAQAFYDFAAAQIGKPYDWRAILRLALGIAAARHDWRDPAQWFCFELVMAAMERAGLIALPPELPIVAVTGNELIVAAAAGAHRFTRS